MKQYTLKTMTKDERSLLLFLETRAVDYGGRVKLDHMNAEDIGIAQKWNKEGFLGFGRIVIRNHNPDGTNWVKMTKEAWTLAHKERKARAKRLWLNKTWVSTEDSKAINGHPHLNNMNSEDKE